MLLSGRTRSSNNPQPIVVLSIQNNLDRKSVGLFHQLHQPTAKSESEWGAVVLCLFVFATIRCETCFDVFCHVFNAAPQIVYAFCHLILLQCRVWATVEWPKRKLATPSPSHYPHSCLLCQSVLFKPAWLESEQVAWTFLWKNLSYKHTSKRHLFWSISKVSKSFGVFSFPNLVFFFSHIGADDAKPHDLGNLGKGPKDFQGQRIRSETDPKQIETIIHDSDMMENHQKTVSGKWATSF